MKLNQLCLSRSNQKILDDISLTLPSPGITVLLGANGAGKSSLLQVLAGIKQPSSGFIEQPKDVRAFWMPEPAVFYDQLTVTEQLSLVAATSDPGQVQERVYEAMEHWQLLPRAEQLTRHLSLGYRQRLSLAQLMVSGADVLLLDEPMNGMDPDVMQLFRQQIETWKRDKTIILATHIMHEAEAMADWVVVMQLGRVLYSKAYQQNMGFYQLYQTVIDEARHSSQSQPVTN